MIIARQLEKRFQDRPVLREISFTIESGAMICLRGPSGSGKTTLLRCLHGLETIDGGELTIEGRTGFVFQHFNLFPHMTVLENLAYAPVKVLKRRADVVEKEAAELLSCVSLPQMEDRYPHQLSGGQKQRVAIARTLMMQPDILLMDEPTSALDPENRNRILRIMQALNDKGKTIVCISHDPEVVQHCRSLVLHEGVLVDE